MDDKIQELSPSNFPPLLREIADPPERLFVRGALPLSSGGAGQAHSPELKWLSVVGSRRYTSYGKEVCESLVKGLAGYPVVIVSGLALGIDALSHRAALSAGLTTIAVPGSGLDWNALYPRNHVGLARDIIAAGGALVSEFEPDFRAAPWAFPKRNRIMAGLSHAVLLIEAAEKSGTLITARLAADYDRDVLAVPGSIFSHNSRGTHQFLRLGATPVTSSEEILDSLDVKIQKTNNKTQKENLSENEQKVLELLHEPLPRDELIRALGIPTQEANILLSAMELKGLIVEKLGVVRIV